MDFDVLAIFGWREALVAVIAILALYVFVVFLRIRRLKRANQGSAIPDPLVARAAVAAYTEVLETEAKEVPDSPDTSPAVPVPLAEPSEAAFPWNEPPPEIPGQKLIEALEREIAQLRDEVGSLHAEVQALREEQQRELTQSQAIQHVSPLYSDAMQLAIQGQDATGISQHCGISRAEAELVVALVRNRENLG